jgi:hypothetical protein
MALIQANKEIKSSKAGPMLSATLHSGYVQSVNKIKVYENIENSICRRITL